MRLKSLWAITLIAVSTFTVINYRPYMFMGGSSSVAPVMNAFIRKYHDEKIDKEIDLNYISSASSAAKPRVSADEFGIGWLSKKYEEKTTAIISFVIMLDGLVIIYNIPKTYLNDKNTVLNFNENIIKKIYLDATIKTWNQVFPNTFNKEINIQKFTRSNGSGTRDVFDKYLGQKYYSANVSDSSAAMLNLDIGGIGYSSWAEYNETLMTNKTDLVVTAGLWEKIPATFTNIKTKKYQLTRPFTGLIKRNYKYKKSLVKFLKWIYSKDVINIFNKYGPRVELNDKDNKKLKDWLDDNKN